MVESNVLNSVVLHDRTIGQSANATFGNAVAISVIILHHDV